LAKFRQVQNQLGDAEERADLNEQALAKAKVHGRGSSLGPMVIFNLKWTYREIPTNLW
jgi:hypothetical protein